LTAFDPRASGWMSNETRWPFVEAAHAGCFNGCGVDEHVLVAAFRRDEAEALLGIEKLYCSDSHVIAPYASNYAMRRNRQIS